MATVTIIRHNKYNDNSDNNNHSLINFWKCFFEYKV